MNPLVQLSKEQIAELFEFTRKKYLAYDDVRIEIVDHLASAIEKQMTADSNLSFDEALKNTYGKFPITGFTQFVESKTAALKKYWRRKIFSVLISYLTLPRALITLLIATLLYKLYFLFPNLQLGHCLLIGFLTFLVGNFLLEFLGLKQKNFLYRKSSREKIGKKYLFMNIYIYTIYVSGSFIAYIITMNFRRPASEGIWLYVYIASLSIITIYYIAIVTGQFRQILIDEINKKYKHLDIDVKELMLA